MPIPVLGPDLIDLRLVEITAERTAQGLVEAREADLVKPAKIPALDPRRPPSRGRAEAARPPGPEQDRPIRPAAGRRPGRRAAPAQPRQARRKKVKRAEARPSLVWLGDAGLKELADRLNAEFGAGTVAIVQAGLLVAAEKLVAVCRSSSATRTRSGTTTSPASRASTTRIASRSTTSSTAPTHPGKLIELRVRTDEAEGEGEVPSVISVWRGADFQEREVYDMMGVRFTGHPELKRILMWDGLRLLSAPQGLPRTLLRRADQGLRQPGRGGPASTSAPRRSTPTART